MASSVNTIRQFSTLAIPKIILKQITNDVFSSFDVGDLQTSIRCKIWGISLSSTQYTAS